jgi:drug/metabolite transporter (DMT)-like permease
MSLVNFGLLFFLSLLWGGSFYFVEKALIYFSYEQIVFFRVFFAAVTMLLFLLIKRVKFDFSLKLWLSFLVMGIFNNVIPFLAFTYAQEGIAASAASIFNATTPIFTAFFAHFYTKDEKLTKLKLFGISIGFLGIVVLVDPSASMSIDTHILFALIAPISYAFAGIFGKILKGENPLFSSFGMLTCSSFVMYVVFYKSVNASHIESFYQISDLLLLAIFSTAIAYIIFFRLLWTVGAVKVLLVTFLIPISASFLGVVLLGEVFTTNMYIGSGVVFIALFLIIKEKSCHT